jgi:hypothetical protein
MDEDGPSNSSSSDDDFQRAAAASEAEAGKVAWSIMPPSEQARAIYQQLKAIDAERAGSLVILPARRGRGQAKTNPSGVPHPLRTTLAPQSESAAGD